MVSETPGSVAERLAGQHVLMTGVTGFVGEALLHLVLNEVPDLRLSVLVRPKGSTTGAARIAKLLEKPIFAEVVAAAGGVEPLMSRSVAVVEGDLADVPALPTDLDAVVHCAGDVSFDPPVDEGFTSNVIGTRDLLARIDEARAGSGREIHYVHISTAYVAGRRRGTIPEAPVEHDVDLEAELAWGLSQRQSVEHRSRSAQVLEKERKKAEKEHGRAGLLTAARATEAARRQWVKDELVRIGTERARSLGWTDCYTFTKAMGERVVERWAAQGNRASIVRPSIIESALERPHVGWIEGFKMAEPLILAYGRGELPEFPASPDTIVDIVPVDHVVAAIVAVLAHPPEPAAPNFFHVSSGDRAPLTFNVLYTSVRTYFELHPFQAGDRGAARLPELALPRRPLGRAAAVDQREGLEGRRLRDRPRPAQRPGPADGPQAAPAGPAAGVPAPLPRPLHGVRHRRAALLRQADARAVRVALARGPGDVRLRHLGDRLAALLPRRALPVGDRARAPPRRAAGAAQEAGGHHPALGRLGRRGRRGVLRHGRHAAVLQRDRDLPLGAAARARRRRAAGRAGPDRVQGPEPASRPSGARAATSCAASTASTRAPASPTSTPSSTST